MSPRILVVEDEESIADAVAYTLRGEGFAVDAVADGEFALEATSRHDYDLILLDLMLPGLSGLEVCRRLRARSPVPILIVTARTAEVDHVVGLEAGADDFITKPFSMPALVGHVRAILRRRELDRAEVEDGRLRQVGGIELDLARRTAKVDGRPIRLTESEFRLLALMMESPGRVFSRRELMQHLWESTYVGDQRAADVHIAHLRRKIEPDPQTPARLLTVRGAGYKLAEM
jgi:two-component system, OmpR family, response regulator RegX3